MKSLWKAAVSDFRDVIETQVQGFQGNVGLQLTAFNAADPVVMPETVRRRKKRLFSSLRKTERISKAAAGPQAGPELVHSEFWWLFNSCQRRNPLQRDIPWSPCCSSGQRPAHRYLQPSRHLLPSTQLLTPLISFSSINLGSPTSLHFQTGFVTCKDNRTGFESQRRGVKISGLTNLPRLYPENGTFREGNK